MRSEQIRDSRLVFNLNMTDAKKGLDKITDDMSPLLDPEDKNDLEILTGKVNEILLLIQDGVNLLLDRTDSTLQKYENLVRCVEAHLELCERTNMWTDADNEMFILVNEIIHNQVSDNVVQLRWR